MNGTEAWPTVFWWVLRTSWQGSVVIGLVLAVQTCLGERLRPAWRHGLWFFVVIRLALPFSFESRASIFNWADVTQLTGAIRSEPQTGENAVDSSAKFPSAPRPVFMSTEDSSNPVTVSTITPGTGDQRPGLGRRLFISVLSALPFLWMLGALFLAARVLWTGASASARLRQRRPASDLPLLELLNDCRQTVGVASGPCIVETPETRAPALFGFSVPYLLLPPDLTSTFSRTELRFVLLHELFHIRRRDVALNWLIVALQTMHWFNPLVWFAFHRLRSDREVACDAAVLSRINPEESRLYGQTIIKLLERFSAPPAWPSLVGLLESRSQMRRRIATIASHSMASSTSPLAAIVFVPALAFATLTDANIPVPLAVPADARPGETVRVRIVEAATERPIAGASVRGAATTGPDGLCRIRVTFPASVTVRARGFVPERAILRKNEGAFAEYVFRMRRARTIGGIVRDENGAPINNVDVRILIQTSAPSGPFDVIGSPFGGFSFKTDREGRWECTEAPAEWRGISLTLAHPAYVEDVFANGILSDPYNRAREPLKAVSAAALFARSAKITMRRGIPIRGRVLDAWGQPIAGAAVREGWSFIYGPHERTTTDGTGRFCFNNVGSGKITLTVQAKGMACQTKLVTVHPGMGEIPIVFEKGRLLRGRVTTERGQPIVGARLITAGSPPECELETTTDPSGRFHWDSAPAAPVEFSVLARGFLPKSHVWLRAGAQEYGIVLQREPRISGTVVDARSGQPIPAFRILTSITAFPDGSARFRWVGTGRDGRLNIPVQQLHRVYDSADSAGTPEKPLEGIRLRIEADGYHPASSCTLYPQTGECLANFALLRRKIH